MRKPHLLKLANSRGNCARINNKKEAEDGTILVNVYEEDPLDFDDSCIEGEYEDYCEGWYKMISERKKTLYLFCFDSGIRNSPNGRNGYTFDDISFDRSDKIYIPTRQHHQWQRPDQSVARMTTIGYKIYSPTGENLGGESFNPPNPPSTTIKLIQKKQ